MEKIGVRAGRCKPRCQGILKHIGRTPGVLSDDNPACLMFPVHLFPVSLFPVSFFPAIMFPAIVPAQEPADLVCVLHCQCFVGFAAEAIGAEVFGHEFFSLLNYIIWEYILYTKFNTTRFRKTISDIP